MNERETTRKTGKLVGPFLCARGVRLRERLAAWFPFPRQAETTASRFAAERTQSPSVGRRSRPGLAWPHAPSGLPAGAGRALRTALPGLLVLLVAVGWAAGARAQTNVTVAMSGADGDANGNAVEGANNATGYRTITITLGRALTASESVTVPLTVVGATVGSGNDYTFGLQGANTGVSLTTTGGAHTAQNPAVAFAAGATSATLRLTPVDNDDRTQPYVVIDYGTGARAPSGSGVTLATPSGGPVGIVLVDDETGDVEVPSSWGLAPSGLSVGDDFRLLFRTSTGRDATSSDIADYDAFVRGVLAGAGHGDIKPYAGFFKVFGGTRRTSGATGTSARVHNGMATTHTGHLENGPWTDGSTRATVGNAAGVPTYWLNGAILANNYADLCDINWSGGNGVTTGWDTDDPRSEDGTRNIPTGAISDYGPYSTWTGSGNACEAYDHPLGNGTVSQSSADSGGGQTLLHASAPANTGTHPFYGYSPVFKLAAAAPTEVTVAPDWALIPSGISAGGKFRLLFVTSTQRAASATDIATYNTFVQNRAKAGHIAITDDMGDQFRVVGSTSSVDARDNTSTTGNGVPIYWLGGSNSNKVADNNTDFYDGSWDNYQNANENGMDTGNGSGAGNATVWTGSNDNGTRHSSNPLGATNVQYGQLFLASTNAPFNRSPSHNSNSRHLYGLSPVFTVAAASAAPVVSVRLMTGEGENRNADGEVEKSEVDGTVSFPLSLDTAPAAALTVCVRVEESGDTDRVTSANEGVKTVSFLAGVQAGSIDVAWTNTAADDLDSVITVTAIPSSTVGCSSSDEYTVSNTHGAEKVRIADDDVTTLSLASTDLQMGEGDAANTAVMTVSLGRALIGGESVVAPITLATTTGARLPGDATPDFGVAATGTGVALSNQTTATPRLTFTGSDSNTVRTATVTLTPVANLDDGDATDETITATLTLLTGRGSGTVVTGGGVEVAQASSTASLSIKDDEAAPPPPAACSAQDGVFSETNLDRILENGGVATYCVRLLTAPSGGDTIVTLGRDGANRWAANFSPATLTFTASDYMDRSG